MYLIETMRVERGDIPLWPWHRRRLERSAASLGVPLLHIKQPETEDGIARMLVHETGNVTVQHRPLPEQPEPYLIGLSPVTVDAADPWLRHKSSNRAPFEEARAWASRHELHDALLCNEAGFVTESTIANLIVEIGGVWYTPPVSDGLLPGVMRAVLLDEHRLVERPLRPRDLHEADAIFLCNAVRGVFRAHLVR